MDERSSAFFALGLSKSTHTPVVVISTSGTAPANFFPAVIEASLSRIPLIILSADRPSYLIGTGANQTINQQELYGSHVRYFEDVGMPLANFNTLEKILQHTIKHSTGAYLELPPGPVHLNFPFDKPLLPNDVQEIEDPQFTFNSFKRNGRNKVIIPVLNKAYKPLVIVGPMEENQYQKDIICFAEKINSHAFPKPTISLNR